MTTSEPALDRIQEKRELLVWGAIPAIVGGVGLIIDGGYVISQYANVLGGFWPQPSAIGPNGVGSVPSISGAAPNYMGFFTNSVAGPMIAVGLITLILLALSRFGKRRLAVAGSVALIVFAVLLLGYLIYALVTGSGASIYSLVLALLIVCLAVAGGSGLMAQRVVVIQ